MKKFKKLLLALLPVTAIAIATPIALTSCSSTAVDAYEANDKFESEFAKSADFKTKYKAESSRNDAIINATNTINNYDGIKDMLLTLNYLSWKTMAINDRIEGLQSLITMHSHEIIKDSTNDKIKLDFSVNLKWKATSNKSSTKKDIIVSLDFKNKDDNNVADLRNKNLQLKFNNVSEVTIDGKVEELKLGGVVEEYLGKELVYIFQNKDSEGNDITEVNTKNFEDIIRIYGINKSLKFNTDNTIGKQNWEDVFNGTYNTSTNTLTISAQERPSTGGKTQFYKSASDDTSKENDTIFKDDDFTKIKDKLDLKLIKRVDMWDLSQERKLTIVEDKSAPSAFEASTGTTKKILVTMSTSNSTFLKDKVDLKVEITGSTSTNK